MFGLYCSCRSDRDGYRDHATERNTCSECSSLVVSLYWLEVCQSLRLSISGYFLEHDMCSGCIFAQSPSRGLWMAAGAVSRDVYGHMKTDVSVLVARLNWTQAVPLPPFRCVGGQKIFINEAVSAMERGLGRNLHVVNKVRIYPISVWSSLSSSGWCKWCCPEVRFHSPTRLIFRRPISRTTSPRHGNERRA